MALSLFNLQGLSPLGTCEGETSTKGLDTLADSCAAYVAQGASFAKWRAALRIDTARGCPSAQAIEVNASQLARYASICQAQGLVPIVEPEILIDGAHDIRTFCDVTQRVVSECVRHLWKEGVQLEACLLKPQMAIHGADYAGPPATAEEVASYTLSCMRR